MSGTDGRTPVTVPGTQSPGKRTGEAEQQQPRAEPTVWTARMLAALEQGVRGGRWRSLIDKLYPITTLRAAFAAVSANQGAAGVDHVTIERYASDLDANLERLSVALRNGTYPVFADSRIFEGPLPYISMRWTKKSSLHQVTRATAVVVILGGCWGGNWNLSCWIRSWSAGSGWV
jgi:hypothetical protein